MDLGRVGLSMWWVEDAPRFFATADGSERHFLEKHLSVEMEDWRAEI